MTVGSLFTGCGGCDLGFQWAGYEIIWQVEINGYCQRILPERFPNAERFSDVRECGKHNLRPVDVIVGGFPCQGISNAGAQEGLADERSGLWSEMLRIVCELRPRIVVIENVAALLNRGIGTVFADLAGAGMDAEWAVLRAEDFGAPHERKRFFAIAYPNGQYGQERMGIKPEWQGALFAEDHRQRLPIWLQAPDCAAGMGDGIPAGLDYRERAEAVGNAVVPQIAEWIAGRISQAVSL